MSHSRDGWHRALGYRAASPHAHMAVSCAIIPGHHARSVGPPRIGRVRPQRTAGPVPCCPTSRCRLWCHHGRTALLSHRRAVDQPRIATLPLPSRPRLSAVTLLSYRPSSRLSLPHACGRATVAMSFKTLRPSRPCWSDMRTPCLVRLCVGVLFAPLASRQHEDEPSPPAVPRLSLSLSLSFSLSPSTATVESRH